MSNIISMLSVQAVTITSGTSLSGAVTLDGSRAIALQMPSAWTTANLTFQASYDGTTYANVYQSDGTEYQVTAGASRYILLSPADFAGAMFLKIRSGTSGSAVNQVADRALQLMVTPL